MSERERQLIVDKLFDEYHIAVKNHCLNKLDRTSPFISSVDDYVQRAFLTLYEQYDEVVNHPNLIGWLNNAAWNCFRDDLRANHNHERIIKDKGHLIPGAVVTVKMGIEAWLDNDTLECFIKQILLMLTVLEKTVFNSYFIEDYSMAETAEKNGLSLNAVRSAIDRIRKRIRKAGKEFFDIDVIP